MNEDTRYAEVARMRDDFVRLSANSDFSFGPATGEGGYEKRDHRADFGAYLLHTAAETDDLYYVSQDICSTIEAAEGNLPDFEVQPDLFPTPTGFVRFAQPFRVPVFNRAFGANEVTAIGAFWAPIVRERVREGDGTKEVQDATYLEYFHEMTPMGDFSYGFPIIHGKHMSDMATRNGVGILEVLRRLLTLFLFMQQRLAITEVRKPPRHIRRASTGRVPSGVKVIRFRRPKRHEVQGGEGQPRDWSCRWIVRGHWRQQWYGPRDSTLRVQRPLWIAQFIKGPDDKPLVTRPHLFNVSR